MEAERGDVITFDPEVFPPNAPVAISLSSGLSPLDQGYLTIDASNAGVILDGSNITIPEFQHGIVISSNYNIIRGLQIVGFTDAGIALSPGSQYNLIGGDRNIGDGALGQGNLISGNHFGVGMWEETTSHNTIQGNYIGITLDATAAWGNAGGGIHSNGAAQNLITGNVIGGNESVGVYLSWVLDGNNTITDNMIGVGPDGNPLANGAGIIIDHTSHNVVGPGNTIAYNLGDGISFWEDTPNNAVTQNSIHDNDERGIAITSPSQGTPQPPVILNFDLQAGTVTGTACPNCTVEIFSDNGDEGAIYEEQALADENGAFTLEKGASLAGPFLTATATDADGNTSEFSPPAQ
jgi:titin